MNEIDEPRIFANPYYILRIDEIPSRIKFYNLLTKLGEYSRHIIGIARTADYRAKRLGRTIYVFCTSLIDARFMEQTYIELVGDGRDFQAPTIVDSILGRAKLTSGTESERYGQLPISVHVKGLAKQKDSFGTTEYLKRIVTSFEDSAVITGIRLNYDAVKRQTRTDGFVTYLYQREAREIGGEIEPVPHLVFNRQVTAVLSDNVPMLVRVPDAHIFERGMCEWSEDADRLNQLTIIRHVPVVKLASVALVKEQNAATLDLVPQQVLQQSITIPSMKVKEQVPATLKSVIVKPTAHQVDETQKSQPSTSAASARVISNKNKRTKRKDMDKLSVTTIKSKRSVTSEKEILVYDSSEEEVRIVKPVDRRVTNWTTKVAPKRVPDLVAHLSSSDEQCSLVINEDVQLDDEELTTTATEK
ncbi:uncharacterized protein [Chironomus tepperi]|uniref:uncharacterized protein n=1 Tax=Chironomus tepperi TaxID=113505 RepID=UPI00391F7F2B